MDLQNSNREREHWFSVQLKPVGSLCNLRCRYCYVRPWSARNGDIAIMPVEILELVVKKCLANSPHPTFSWHGGEPALAKYEFFKSAMNLMDRYRRDGQTIRNLIQTNGTEINPQIAQLFKDYEFGVSVSLDGPSSIHGINRVTRNGENSFPEVIKGIEVLRDNGVDPSVICTVSRDTLPFAIEVFNFLIDNGFQRIKYSPVFDSVNDAFSLSNEEWFEYLKKVFNRWFEIGDSAIQVRELDEVIAWLSTESLKLCSTDRTCLHWVSIDPKGEIYPCEYLRVGYTYGNISRIDLNDVFCTSRFQDFRRKYETIPPQCEECHFLKLCGNGCPATRIKEGKVSPEGIYAFCQQRQSLFYTIQKAFNETLLEGGDE